jgi:molybdenum cofactor cytidylyltransferase
MADLDVEPADIMAMGVGGLLKEIPSRPQPREGARVAKPKSAPRIAALVLAAGRSTRMGGPNSVYTPLDHCQSIGFAKAPEPASIITLHPYLTGNC